MATQLINRKTALTELTRILKKIDRREAFHEVGTLIEKIFDPKTPTYELDRFKVQIIFYENGKHMLIPLDTKKAYEELRQALDEVLRLRGYRSNILTYQEHCLLGSTQSETFARDPYKPIGILRRELGIEETMLARKLELKGGARAYFYGLKREGIIGVTTSLEPLDTEGRTVRDPRPISMEKLDEALAKGIPLEQIFDLCVIPFVKDPEFPFRRE
ncbi:MAG: hypothetical protein Q7S22_05645 [Candidatus Micrarchaeota archaeon]|nr:hypothetical protein [Candidatus Micrarchaeota archaeon]